MAKPIKLETTKVDITVAADKSKGVSKGRHKFDSSYVTMHKADLARLVSDLEKLVKAVKKAGLKIERPPHYNETKEWKKEKNAPPPLFLKNNIKSNPKSDKKKRVRL